LGGELFLASLGGRKKKNFMEVQGRGFGGGESGWVGIPRRKDPCEKRGGEINP